VNLETTLERTSPTAAQWVAWTQQEPALADLAYRDMRWQLRTASPARKDELLGALVRLVQTDPAAFGVLAACMLPALRHRVAQHAPSLDRQDAVAVITAGLYEAAVRYDVESHPRYVAETLLALPTRRLRRAVAMHRRWNAHARHTADGVSHTAGLELSPPGPLAGAVDAGVLTANRSGTPGRLATFRAPGRSRRHPEAGGAQTPRRASDARAHGPPRPAISPSPRRKKAS
jgi:hypothetical protein